MLVLARDVCLLRNLDLCYRRESGSTKRNSNKLQEHGRTGWRSRSSKKHLVVSPMCPRCLLEILDFPAVSDSVETMVERSLAGLK